MAGVDVRELLARARERAGLSQTALARVAHVPREVISSYETGRRSPTVVRLNALLAACGLQARVQLEPLLADLDERVDALCGPVPELDVATWTRLVASLEDRPGSVMGPAARSGGPRGRGTWAVDGASALVLHHVAVPPAEVEEPQLVVLLDQALRLWLRALMVVGHDEQGRALRNWLEPDLATMTAFLAQSCWGLLGSMQLRVVDRPPATLHVVVPWAQEPVRVVTVEEVERAFPARAEVLARWRQRRAAGPGPAI